MKKVVITVLLLFAGLSSAQAKVWTLRECVEYAMVNNINIKSNMVDIELAELNTLQAKENYIPTVGANVGYNMYTGRALDPTTYEYQNQTVNNINMGATASTSIFQGMLKYHTLKKSQIDLLSAKQDVAKFKNDISLNIALYYLEIIYNKELIVTLEKQIENSKVNVERMTKLFDVGSATKGEILDMQAQMANEEYSLVDGQNRLKTSKLNLCQLLELKDYEDFDVQIPDINDLANIFPQEDVEDIFNVAQSLPEIEGAKYRLQSSERNIKVAQSRMYPSINANFGYSSAYSDSRKIAVNTPAGIEYEKYKFWSQVKDNKGSSLSVSLSIPILNQFMARNNVKIARFNHKKAEYALRNAEVKLYKDVQQAHNDAIGAMKKFDAALVRVKANEESISYSESKFSAGSITVTDYNIAKNNLLIAQAQMLQAKYDYIFKVQILEFYKGVPVGLTF